MPSSARCRPFDRRLNGKPHNVCKNTFWDTELATTQQSFALANCKALWFEELFQGATRKA